MTIRDFTTGKTKFVQIVITAPDGRFGGSPIRGGLTRKTALVEAKKIDNKMVIDIFDSKESINDIIEKQGEGR